MANEVLAQTSGSGGEDNPFLENPYLVEETEVSPEKAGEVVVERPVVKLIPLGERKRAGNPVSEEILKTLFGKQTLSFEQEGEKGVVSQEPKGGELGLEVRNGVETALQAAQDEIKRIAEEMGKKAENDQEGQVGAEIVADFPLPGEDELPEIKQAAFEVTLEQTEEEGGAKGGEQETVAVDELSVGEPVVVEEVMEEPPAVEVKEETKLEAELLEDSGEPKIYTVPLEGEKTSEQQGRQVEEIGGKNETKELPAIIDEGKPERELEMEVAPEALPAESELREEGPMVAEEVEEGLPTVELEPGEAGVGGELLELAEEEVKLEPVKLEEPAESEEVEEPLVEVEEARELGKEKEATNAIELVDVGKDFRERMGEEELKSKILGRARELEETLAVMAQKGRQQQEILSYLKEKTAMSEAELDVWRQKEGLAA